MTYVVYIDIKASSLTMGQALRAFARIQEEHPDQEIFIDGNLHAIVGRPKEATA